MVQRGKESCALLLILQWIFVLVQGFFYFGERWKSALRKCEWRYFFVLLAKTVSQRFKAGVSNIQPAGQIRPVAWLDPGRGMILWNKNFFVCLRSLSNYTSITGDCRFQFLATLTQLLIFYCFSLFFFTWQFTVFCIFPFACSLRFDLSNRYEHANVQSLLIKFNTGTPGKKTYLELQRCRFRNLQSSRYNSNWNSLTKV